MSVSAALAPVLCVVLLTACGSAQPAPATSDASGALSIDSRGAPELYVVIGGSDVARVPCDGGVVLRPRDAGAPALPWALQLRAAAGGRVLFTSTVTELPQWIAVVGEEPLVSRSPILGPRGPTCR